MKPRALGTHVIVLALLMALLPAAAIADKGEYPETQKSFWRPTYGTVDTIDLPSSWAHDGRVNETFEWLGHPNLRKIDAPRTPEFYGTYEHELRFFSDSTATNIRWCFDGPYDTFVDLPSDWYRDTVGTDAGEYTWGMAGWELQTGYLYAIEFKCNKSRDQFGQLRPLNPEYNLTSQAGHCHPDTNGYHCYESINVYADETVRQIPRRIGRAPGSNSFFESFTWGSPAGAGFESGKDPWDISNGSGTRVCDASKAYQASCFLRLDSASGNTAQMTYDYAPYPSAVGTGQVYNETMAKCPTFWNGAACHLELRITGFDGNGNLTDWRAKDDVLPRDDYWHPYTFMPGGGWPTGTTKWRFRMRTGTSETVQFDYNQQHYGLPL
jgi:hypothetical protein